MSFSVEYDGLPQVVSVEVLQGELEILKDNLARIEEEMRIAARRLESGKRYLERKRFERDEIQGKISDKENEIHKARDIDTLVSRLDDAAAQRDQDAVRAIGNRIKSIEPSLSKNVDSRRFDLAWKVVSESPTEDYQRRRRALETAEMVCKEVRDEQGVQDARMGLATLDETHGDQEKEEGNPEVAADYYCQALDSFIQLKEYPLQIRVLQKLIAVYKTRDPIEAVRHSRERITLLCQEKRLNEAKDCYISSLGISMRLPDEVQGKEWAQNLTAVITRYYDGPECLAELEEIGTYIEQASTSVISSEIVAPILKKHVQKILEIHRSNLHSMELQIARYGGNEIAPPSLLDRKDQIVEEIKHLEALSQDLNEVIVSGVPVVDAAMDCRRRSGERVGIPAKLHNRLRTFLSQCGPFSNDDELRAVFIDARINPWHDGLPQAKSRIDRVQATIDWLHDRYSSTGENALVLLLHVLSELTHPGDRCREELAKLADELGSVLQRPA